VVATAALLAGRAAACLWDYDTLAAEATAKPDLVRVITGRFERNPPLYYEMRLARVANELRQDPSQIAAYDDAAVACDRLGRDDEAIAWIQKKRKRLESLGPAAAHKDDWYRTYANEGTFYAHRWLHDGAPMARVAELKKARDLIERALKVNPDAHFGREVYQLIILDWLLAVKQGKIGASLGEYVEREVSQRKLTNASAAEGLAGLVRLGNAWQSVDVFNALSTVLSNSNDGILAELSRFRAEELKAAGAHSMTPAQEAPYMWRPEERWREFNSRQFAKLRKEAEQWHKDREAYMLARLKQGRHPDTDKAFWNEYHAAQPPEIDSPPFWTSTGFFMWLTMLAAVAVLVGGILVLVFIGTRFARQVRTRKARRG
jgi:hypothetical protein